MWIEANIDGLVGPSHHFSGLGVGNIASHHHAGQVSSPRQAALQGLDKAELLASLGVPQFLMPPPTRPHRVWLRQCGFEGPLDEQLRAASETAPHVLSAAYSSAFMWMANSATVTPSYDAGDGRLHLTPANLISSWHRGLEAAERGWQLQRFFARCDRAIVHAPLPSIIPLRDEGAANQMRLSDPGGRNAIHVFVHGADQRDESADHAADGFFPRQTEAACAAIARRHRIAADALLLIRQNSQAIDAGVFHNDVIATGHLDLLLHHEHAFAQQKDCIEQLEAAFRRRTGATLTRIEVSDSELPLADAVRSYFFNSQLVTPHPAQASAAARRGASPAMVLISPTQCRQVAAAHGLIDRLVADPQVPIDAVRFVPLEQSMSGGGGPACLRLRVPLEETSLAALPTAAKLDDVLAEQLRQIIVSDYPQQLSVAELGDPQFADHCEQVSRRLQRLLL